jgi:hypothetical protein
MSGDIRLELSLEVAKALVGLEQVIRAEQRADEGMQKTVRSTKGVAAAMKELAEQAKSLDQIRAAMAAGDERRLKSRLQQIEQEAQAQSRLRAIEAQRLNEIGQRRLDHYAASRRAPLAEKEVALLREAAIEMRALPALTKEQERSLKGMEAPAAAVAKSSRDMAAATGMGLANLRGMAAGWLGIGAAMQSVSTLISDYEARMNRIRGTNLSLAQQQATFIRQAAGEDPAAVQSALAAIPAMAKRTAYGDPAQLQGALNKALAAYGGDVPAAMAAVEAAAPLARGSQSDVEALSVAGLSMAKSTGRTDPRWNIGLASLIGKYARPEDPSIQARNIGQALARAAPYSKGDQETVARQGGAIYAAMTQMGEDVTGEEAAGAYYRVQQQMREYFGKWGIDDPQYPLARIQALRARPDLAREFMEHAEFGHQRFKSTFEELFFSPESSPANKFLRQGLAGITETDPAAVYEEQKRQLETATPQIRQQVIAAGAEASDKGADIRKTNVSLRAEARDRFNKLLVETRPYHLKEESAGLLSMLTEPAAVYLAEATTQDDAAMVRMYRERLQQRQEDILGYGVWTPRKTAQLSETERADYDRLQEAIVALNRTLMEMDRNNAEQRGRGAAAQGEAGLPMH